MQLMNIFSNEQSANVLAEEALDFILQPKKYIEYKMQLRSWEIELEGSPVERANRIAEIFNCDVEGHGDRRVVFYYNDLAIKVPMETYYKDSNYNEYKLYNYIKENHRDLLDYLCPVLGFKDDIVVMPFCEKYNDSQNDCDKVIEEITKAFSDVGIYFTDLYNTSQFGIYEDRVVLLDYEDYETEINLSIYF